MKFETGMENNTSDMCDGGECESCPTDPNVLIEFKHAIHALGGKWKLEILFTLMNGVCGSARCAARSRRSPSTC
ncbi:MULTISPECIES: hypothetical protein [Bradyrhizobium]|uniref:hypothetical protein n=1 Tax=Bradyrhizobium TaxID=374 RepID=UPI00190F82A3|nr:DNA-binding HxlR family transcriptional regulator [Bradyrhizobium sp. USDA 4541]MCP1914682.1 DNA-binding HxlR family transcriptional regulator [Bradyrhizobium elkanii]